MVEGNQKAPFSIATTPKCRGGRYSFPWIAPLYTRTYLILLNVKQGGIKSLVRRDLGLNPGLLDHWRTLYPLGHETLVPFETISSGCNAFVVPFQQLLEGLMQVLLCQRVHELRHSLFHLFNSLVTAASELRE